MTDASSVSAPVETWALRFTLNQAEYAQWFRASRWTLFEKLVAIVPSVAVGALGSLAGMLIGLSIEYLFDFRLQANARLVVLIASIGAMISFWFFVVMPRYMLGLLRGQPLGMGETVVVIDGSALVSSSSGVETKATWANICAIRETATLVLLEYARLAAIVIPKRAFSTKEDTARFLDFARGCSSHASEKR